MASAPAARAIEQVWTSRFTRKPTQRAMAVCPAVVELVDASGQARLVCTDELVGLGCPATAATTVAAGDRVELTSAPTHAGGAACRVRPDGMRAAWMLTWGYPLDINRRSAQELACLPGIGMQLAERIVAHRAQAGAFASLEGLLAVRGVGRKSLEKLRPYLKADAPAS